MTETPPAPTPQARQPRRAAAPAEGAGKWTLNDLRLQLAHERISTALLAAAMADAGKTYLDSPAEARALVEAFASKPAERTYP